MSGEEVVVTYLEVLFQNSPSWNEENYRSRLQREPDALAKT
jgi:hypothetical protein